MSRLKCFFLKIGFSVTSTKTVTIIDLVPKNIGLFLVKPALRWRSFFYNKVIFSLSLSLAVLKRNPGCFISFQRRFLRYVFVLRFSWMLFQGYRSLF